MAKITDKSKKYSDFPIEFTRNPITNDLTVVRDDIAIKRALRNLVQSTYYDRMFEAGVGIKQQILFKSPNSITAEQLQREIERLIRDHEPRVTLGSVIITPEPQNNRWAVDIIFAIKNTVEPITISNLFVERIR